MEFPNWATLQFLEFVIYVPQFPSNSCFDKIRSQFETKIFRKIALLENASENFFTYFKGDFLLRVL